MFHLTYTATPEPSHFPVLNWAVGEGPSPLPDLARFSIADDARHLSASYATREEAQAVADRLNDRERRSFRDYLAAR